MKITFHWNNPTDSIPPPHLDTNSILRAVQIHIDIQQIFEFQNRFIWLETKSFRLIADANCCHFASTKKHFFLLLCVCAPLLSLAEWIKNVISDFIAIAAGLPLLFQNTALILRTPKPVRRVWETTRHTHIQQERRRNRERKSELVNVKQTSNKCMVYCFLKSTKNERIQKSFPSRRKRTSVCGEGRWKPNATYIMLWTCVHVKMDFIALLQ